MPSVATDNDPGSMPTVQRPNNGELADAASLSQGFNPLTQRSRHTYNRTRSKLFDVTRAPYNANNVMGADASSAIAAAMADANALGGDVYLPGQFRIDDVLPLYPGLRIFGDPLRTSIFINHASESVFELQSSGVLGSAGIIEDINFNGLVANSGNVFYNPSGITAAYIVRNCGMNTSSSNLQGRFFLGIASSDWTFEDCNVVLTGTGGASDGYRQDGSNGQLAVVRGSIFAPSSGSSSSRLVYGVDGRVTLDGVRLDASSFASAFNMVTLLGTSKLHRITRCMFDGNSNTVVGVLGATGIRLLSKANRFVNAITPYSGSAWHRDSDLDMGPANYADAFTSTIVPDAMRRAQSIRCSATGGGIGVTVNMPAPLYLGHEFDLTLMNDSGTHWTTGVAFGGGTVVGAETAGINDQFARTWRLRGMSPRADGNLVWLTIGKPTDMFAVP